MFSSQKSVPGTTRSRYISVTSAFSHFRTYTKRVPEPPPLKGDGVGERALRRPPSCHTRETSAALHSRGPRRRCRGVLAVLAVLAQPCKPALRAEERARRATRCALSLGRGEGGRASSALVSSSPRALSAVTWSCARHGRCPPPASPSSQSRSSFVGLMRSALPPLAKGGTLRLAAQNFRNTPSEDDVCAETSVKTRKSRRRGDRCVGAGCRGLYRTLGIELGGLTIRLRRRGGALQTPTAVHVDVAGSESSEHCEIASSRRPNVCRSAGAGSAMVERLATKNG